MPDTNWTLIRIARCRSLSSVAAMKKLLPVATALSLGVASFGAVSADAAKPKCYANCTALHRDYPHGVGRSRARDRVRGSTRPVNNFTMSTRVYNLNSGSDRDRD